MERSRMSIGIPHHPKLMIDTSDATKRHIADVESAVFKKRGAT